MIADTKVKVTYGIDVDGVIRSRISGYIFKRQVQGRNSLLFRRRYKVYRLIIPCGYNIRIGA